MKCELCGHVFAQKHRVVPGSWGGTYRDSNVVHLCPNHHTAIHFLMVRWLRRQALDPGRFAAYRADEPLWRFWKAQVKPVCMDHKSALKRIRTTGRKAHRKVNRMTADQFLRVIQAVRSWYPPMGVTTDIFEVDAKRFRVTIFLNVHLEGRTLIIEDFMPEEEVHKFFEDQTNAMAGCDLRAEAQDWIDRHSRPS